MTFITSEPMWRRARGPDLEDSSPATAVEEACISGGSVTRLWISHRPGLLHE